MSIFHLVFRTGLVLLLGTLSMFFMQSYLRLRRWLAYTSADLTTSKRYQYIFRASLYFSLVTLFFLLAILLVVVEELKAILLFCLCFVPFILLGTAATFVREIFSRHLYRGVIRRLPRQIFPIEEQPPDDHNFLMFIRKLGRNDLLNTRLFLSGICSLMTLVGLWLIPNIYSRPVAEDFTVVGISALSFLFGFFFTDIIKMLQVFP